MVVMIDEDTGSSTADMGTYYVVEFYGYRTLAEGKKLIKIHKSIYGRRSFSVLGLVYNFLKCL